MKLDIVTRQTWNSMVAALTASLSAWQAARKGELDATRATVAAQGTQAAGQGNLAQQAATNADNQRQQMLAAAALAGIPLVNTGNDTANGTTALARDNLTLYTRDGSGNLTTGVQVMPRDAARTQSQRDYGNASGARLHLPRFLGKLQRGEAVTVVITGSSSFSHTTPSASNQAASFPMQLLSRLQSAYPNATITLEPLAVPGSQIGLMEDGFLTAAAKNADLWIVGTGANEANNNYASYLPEFRQRLEQYLRAAREYGADVVAMDTQFYPDYNPHMQSFARAVQDAARAAGVQFFSRELLMRGWIDRGEYTFAQVLWGDLFHANDLGYRLWAEGFFRAILSASQDDEQGVRISVHQSARVIHALNAPAATDYGAVNQPSLLGFEQWTIPAGTAQTYSTLFVGTGIRLGLLGGPWYQGATVRYRVDGGAWVTVPTSMYTPGANRFRGGMLSLVRGLPYAVHLVEVEFAAGSAEVRPYLQGWEVIARTGAGRASDSLTALYGAARVVSGMVPSLTGTRQVAVGVGEMMLHGHVAALGNTRVSPVTLDAGDAQPRIDVVYYGWQDKLLVAKGTPAASPTVPVLPAAGLPLAQVLVAAGATTNAGLTLTDVRNPIRP